MASMPSLAALANHFGGDVSGNFLAVLDGFVMQSIAAVGGAENRAAAGKNTAKRLSA
jgi:hypothetical protein